MNSLKRYYGLCGIAVIPSLDSRLHDSRPCCSPSFGHFIVFFAYAVASVMAFSTSCTWLNEDFNSVSDGLVAGTQRSHGCGRVLIFDQRMRRFLTRCSKQFIDY